MTGLDLELLSLLALVGLVAGLVDAIAGGGGLITVPALLVAGLDPVTAVATNKLQGTFGSASATYAFARAGKIGWREALPMAAVALVGSVGGALTVKLLPVALLAGVMPLVLIGVAVYFALSPKVRDADARRRITPLAFMASVAVGVGFYDGVFGPGAGSFYMLGFVTLLGFGVVRATAHTKLLNFASNLGALVFFAVAGAIVWPLGLVMGLCQFAGAQIGARMALRHGARLIRPLIVVVCCAMAVRLLVDPANPLRVTVLAMLGI
ncbi:TSUP family transporter [Chelatococcus sp. SYSU_G07232]|uniref:Probable membrane transporter protein n=1 Tax=Chelatococcus albus TaxID=3047466 RepID=A0ABT7AHK4_9HYPH|nr:TSUP family transporter [Chelatococcus sp. SYSU_G07232]MDJ1158865.1 TSUP family transporter [Chelatococcus sp. SYSU_G07232]